MKDLTTPADLEAALSGAKGPLILFKHSTV
jgi:hypothetical protein